MSSAISTHLQHRFDRLEAEDRGSGLVISLFMHLAIVAVAWLAASWAPEPLPFEEFSQVRLVPVAALGSRSVPPQQRPTPPQRQVVPDIPLEEPEQTEPEVIPSPSGDPPQEQSPTPADQDQADRDRSTPQRNPTSSQRTGSPTGSLLGTSLSGSGAASLDSPDFTYSYYTDQILAQIDGVWNRPVIGGEIEAVVHFVIRRDGSLADVKLSRSSGYNSFDLAAMRAIRAAEPFPPLPAAFRSATLGVNLSVR